MKKKIALVICYTFIITKISAQLFEGSITYRVNVTPLIENHKHNDYFVKRWGDEMTIYHDKNGNQLRKFVNSGGVEYQIYNNKENKFYSKFVGYDTLYFYSCATNIFENVSFEEKESRKILDHECRSIIKTEFLIESQDTVKSKMFYSEKLPIPWRKYKHFKDGHLNELYEKTKSHLLWYDIKTKEYIVEFEAINIEEKSLDDSLFKIPFNIPIELIKN